MYTEPDVLSPPDGAWRSLAINYETGCGIDVDGSITCWGAPMRVPTTDGGTPGVMRSTDALGSNNASIQRGG